MRRILGLMLLMIPALLFAQEEVAEDELRELGTADINFINYEGPHQTIQSDEEIRGIGRALARGLAGGAAQYQYAGKYSVIHAVGPAEEQGFDADIIIPLATARVDHIDNVRRIISGYLSEMYGYNRTDGDTLARFVTIYNAVSRGNMEFFRGRYKNVVVQHLDAATAGLSRRYDEWPGKSRIVIPLSGRSGLGTIPTQELGDERVVEELRSQEDMGIEDRQDMVDLSERIVEERESQIAQEEQAIQQEEERIAQRESEIAAEREQLAEERKTATQEQQAELDQRERQLGQEQAAVEEDQRAVEERRQDLQEERQQVAELTAQVREERERIASDTRSLLDEQEISDEVRGIEGGLAPVYFIQVREESGTVLGQLVQINPVTGLLVNRSVENAIVSRTYTFLDESLLVLAADSGTARLATFDVTTLEEQRRGSEVIFLGSSLAVHGEPAGVYAVVQQEGGWYVGHFGSDLELIERSVIEVNPYTTFAFGGDKIWIQTKDDRIVALSLSDMRIAP